VLQCVEVRCSVLLCVAACCSVVLQSAAKWVRAHLEKSPYKLGISFKRALQTKVLLQKSPYKLKLPCKRALHHAKHSYTYTGLFWKKAIQTRVFCKKALKFMAVSKGPYTHKTSIYVLLHLATLQPTATHCNTLRHTATHRNTLQHKVHPYMF